MHQASNLPHVTPSQIWLIGCPWLICVFLRLLLIDTKELRTARAVLVFTVQERNWPAQRCHMVQAPTVFSTSRDIVVASVIFRHPHLKVNLRHLRSTGCQARILILLENGHPLDADFPAVINETVAELIFFGN
jgi:hypothetical protein